MPQNEDDYETDDEEKMRSTHKRIEYVVRCVLLLLFFSLSEKRQIIVIIKGLDIFTSKGIEYNNVPSPISKTESFIICLYKFYDA
jgi:hypothetical protein